MARKARLFSTPGELLRTLYSESFSRIYTPILSVEWRFKTHSECTEKDSSVYFQGYAGYGCLIIKSSKRVKEINGAYVLKDTYVIYDSNRDSTQDVSIDNFIVGNIKFGYWIDSLSLTIHNVRDCEFERLDEAKKCCMLRYLKSVSYRGY